MLCTHDVITSRSQLQKNIRCDWVSEDLNSGTHKYEDCTNRICSDRHTIISDPEYSGAYSQYNVLFLIDSLFRLIDSWMHKKDSCSTFKKLYLS